MSAPAATDPGKPRRFPWATLILAGLAFAVLVSLGTWQLQRLAWKEGLIATIEQRIASPPAPIAEIETLYGATQDVDYQPVSASGSFVNEAERHFFATFDGASGFYIYTPLRLDDGRYVFVNRGFVPYDRKEPQSRPESWPRGPLTVTGLARNPLAGKPSVLVPENDPVKNVFYWKDLGVMASTAGLPADATVLPFFIDADNRPNPGGLPVGGVTMTEQTNNHLQYMLTWYGLAAALVAVTGLALNRRRRGL